jgi:uncharacterized repeat protein (TIGR03803 family)
MLPTSRFLLALVLGLFMTCNPAAAQTVTILYHFTGGTDGGYPMGTLNLDARGNIYGTATVGGDLVNCAPSGCGVVFELDPSGNYTVLHAFNSLDGSSPQGDLTGDGTGNIYGTAELGGDSQNAGVAFKLDSGGTCTTLHAFTAGSDGGEPMTGFLRDSQNNLYGTALIGGKPNSCQGFGCGLVFKLDSSGNQTVLHNFSFSDGAGPQSDLISDQFHNLYGTTSGGGIYGNPPCVNRGCGVIYRITPSGNEGLLYKFQSKNDGYYPVGRLLADSSGNLYGATRFGGPSSDFGTLFKLNRSGQKVMAHAFSGFPTDGRNPLAGLVPDPAGNMYGTTSGGGVNDGGTIFRISPGGKFQILYSFGGNGAPDGGLPAASLIRDSQGNFYGTTLQGGLFGYGVIFKLSP